MKTNSQRQLLWVLLVHEASGQVPVMSTQANAKAEANPHVMTALNTLTPAMCDFLKTSCEHSTERSSPFKLMGQQGVNYFNTH